VSEARKKEKWNKPKLIVLVKSKPEESVLGYCKGGWDYDPTPGDVGGGCFQTNCSFCYYPASTS